MEMQQFLKNINVRGGLENTLTSINLMLDSQELLRSAHDPKADFVFRQQLGVLSFAIAPVEGYKRISPSEHVFTFNPGGRESIEVTYNYTPNGGVYNPYG